MSVYITGIGNISPQKTFATRHFPVEVEAPQGSQRKITTPDYKAFIDPKMLRRMSGILKMGVAAGAQALKDAGIKHPDAVITATALGCTQDTHRFLKQMVEMEEQTLSPTSFIQSTHNTIGGQIALMLGLQAYNMTYTQRGFSFESALLDSLMMLFSNEAAQVLVGGIDELIDPVHVLLQRMGVYQSHNPNRGTVGGEGAAFFVLSTQAEGSYAKVVDVQTHFKVSDEEWVQQCDAFLAQHGLKAEDVDLLITGRNGIASEDEQYDQLNTNLFSNTPEAIFKLLCGEYPTAIGFAMWFGALCLFNNQVPEYARFRGSNNSKLQTVLICNHFGKNNRSFILLTR